MGPEATVLAGIISPLIQAGLSLGMSRAQVHRLLEHDTRLPAETIRVGAVHGLMKAIAERGYDVVTAAAAIRCNDFGLPGFLLQTAPTARQAIEAIPWFYPLVSNFGTYRHRAPQRTGSHAKLFNCAVHFGADENALVVPHRLLEQRPKLSNPAMFRYLSEHAQAEMATLGRPPQFSDRVRAQILEGIADGISAPVVARQLGVSERTLRRRLEENGQSFRDLLEQTRMAAADRMLGDGDRTISEIASDLGFSEPSAFSRFYRRQHGMSPRRRWPRGG